MNLETSENLDKLYFFPFFMNINIIINIFL